MQDSRIDTCDFCSPKNKVIISVIYREFLTREDFLVPMSKIIPSDSISYVLSIKKGMQMFSRKIAILHIATS